MVYEIKKENVVQFGDVAGLSYTLKTPKQGEIVVTYLPAESRGENGNGRALAFVSGMFTSRKFWLSDKGVGLVAYLNHHGFHCFMIDRRGVGESTKQQPNISYDCFWQDDLPALQQFIVDKGFAKTSWIGHSFGGVAFTLSLAKKHMKKVHVDKMVTFSSQLTVGKAALNPPLSWLSLPILFFKGYLPARLAGLGPEDESAQVVKDIFHLVKWAKNKTKPADFWQGFDAVDCPVLSFGSVGDTVDHFKGCKSYHDALGFDGKRFILLGKKFDFVEDYSHAGMVISKSAQKEIWPMVLAWLK